MRIGIDKTVCSMGFANRSTRINSKFFANISPNCSYWNISDTVFPKKTNNTLKSNFFILILRFLAEFNFKFFTKDQIISLASRYSAICTALVAAPFRRLSATIQRFKPLSTEWSRRIRPTKTPSLSLANKGMGY